MKALWLITVLWLAGGCYSTRMALHHNDLFNSRRPVAAVIQDPSTPEKTRQALENARAVLSFAKEQGLNTRGAYRYYIDTGQPVVSYLVQAAHSDRLEFVTWWFPVVGAVPYLGFFEESERDAKAAELAAAGYDVNKGAAGAFSSLGWFEDPLFSSMLARGETDLAHLLLHELTHRTLWVPGSVEFNENLAEYAASVLTRDYLVVRGLGPDQLARYGDKLADKAAFRAWLWDLKQALSTLYEDRRDRDQAGLLAAKQAIFTRFLSPARKPRFKVVDYVAGEDWNNASVLGAALYAPDVERFAEAHRCLGSGVPIRAFLDALEASRRASSSGDPFAALKSLCPAPRI